MPLHFIDSGRGTIGALVLKNASVARKAPRQAGENAPALSALDERIGGDLTTPPTVDELEKQLRPAVTAVVRARRERNGDRRHEAPPV